MNQIDETIQYQALFVRPILTNLWFLNERNLIFTFGKGYRNSREN